MSADGARKLFVGGLADSATEEELRSVFEGAGFVVEHLALPRDRESGRLRGFAFITLTNEAEASRARSELQGADVCGRPLSIREFSQEPPKRGPGNERGGPRQPEPTVFLGKLPFDATQEEIQELFVSQGAGRATRVSLPLGPDGRPRGFGFATLADQDQVDLAVSKVNGATLKGRQIVVSPAQPRGAPTGGAGGGLGGGGSRERSEGRPPRAGGGYPPRPSDRGGSDSGFDGGYRVFDGPLAEPPVFPPTEGRGGRRRHEPGGGSARKEKREKRRGAGSATGSEASSGSSGAGRGAGKRRRGGGANWHQWESEDD